MGSKEIWTLIFLGLVVAAAAFAYFGSRDPLKRYKQDEYYCREDYDCATVYDLLNNRCFTVNNVNRYRYDDDVICHRRIAKCANKKCYLP